MTKIIRNIGAICLFALVCVNPIMAQDKAYPLEGDGFMSFLRRWNRIDNSYINEFKELNKSLLNNDGGLELGVSYFIPPLHPGDVYPPRGPRYEPTSPTIFGKDFEIVPALSTQLSGACFYIISGHGGPDPGALTKIEGHTLHEDEYNYDFSLRLARNLMQHGATVYIVIQDRYDGIRNERFLRNSNSEWCFDSPIPRSQVDRLKQRVDKVNELFEFHKDEYKYVRALEIHIDSRPANQQIDMFFYYADNPASRLSSYKLRNALMEQYKKHQPGRGFVGNVSHRNMYILRNLNPPSLMLEVGNFQNERDRKRILDPNNRQAVANWLAQAFIDDFERVKQGRRLTSFPTKRTELCQHLNSI